MNPTFEDVLAAQQRTAHLVIKTPLVEFDHLNALAGRRVLVKVETLQRTGAFKFRGATARLTHLSQAEKQAGVVAYSTGNHGMAVAEAARLLGIEATIVVPADAPAVKIARMRESGAKISLCDRYKENGEEVGREFARTKSAIFVHPFDDPIVVAGQGTLALEVIEQATELGITLDAMLVNSAGGGFVSGCALAIDARSPNTQTWSVECTSWDAIRRSIANGKHEDNCNAAPSICDALQARSPGKTGYAIFSERISHAIAVSDQQALEALRFAFQRLRLVVEPGGVVGLAAILNGMIPAEIQTVAIVLCGGNVDAEKYSRWLTEPTQ